jgi:hypothetical protein
LEWNVISFCPVEGTGLSLFSGQDQVLVSEPAHDAAVLSLVYFLIDDRELIRASET